MCKFLVPPSPGRDLIFPAWSLNILAYLFPSSARLPDPFSLLLLQFSTSGFDFSLKAKDRKSLMSSEQSRDTPLPLAACVRVRACVWRVGVY